MPLFVGPDTRANELLPALGRRSVDELVREADELARPRRARGDPLRDPARRRTTRARARGTTTGSSSRRSARCGRASPSSLLLTDVCLCEYTAHGHCGVLRDGEVDNDATLELLARTAVSHVEAGADVVAPSDMMDGRVGAIRAELPRDADRRVLAPSTPRRSTARSARPPSRRRRSATAAATRWIRPTSARRCASARSTLDEGADVLMVKPALPYLDVIRAVRERFDLPGRARTTSPASTRW